MSLRQSELALLLALTLSPVVVSCGPSDPVQTVSFVLDLSSDRLSRMNFVVGSSSGSFVGSDGGCVVGAAAGPRSSDVRTGTDATVKIAVAPGRSRTDRPRGIPLGSTITTATVTSTTVTTTTMAPTTTTSTTLPPALTCSVVFRMTNVASVGALQWSTNYAAAAGQMAGSDAAVDCASLVVGTVPAFNDHEATSVLTSGLISLVGFTAPTDLSQCVFLADVQPQISDFVISVDDAVDPDGLNLDPVPTIVVKSVECEGGATTTTSTTVTTTTTTIPGTPVCGNGTKNSGEECDDGNVVSGDGCDANCIAEFEFTAVNNDAGELSIHIVNGKGIAPGATLAFCKFKGDVDAANLTVSLTDCGFPSGGTCDPATDAEVTVSTTTTTTTTTTTSTTTSTTKTTTTTTTLL